MSSPAKRRKTDKDIKQSKPSRNLDFFFRSRPGQDQDFDQDAKPDPTVSAQSATDTEDGALTDEQLARKLQEEWNKEDVPSSSAPEPAQVPEAPILPKLEHSEPAFASPNRTDSMSASQEQPSASNEQPTEAPSNPPLSQDLPSGKHTLSLQSATAAEDTITQTIPFDQSPLTFEPTKYIPDLQRQWNLEGGSATYSLLTRCFVLVNSTQSRIKIVDNLVNLLRVVIEGDPESLLPLVSLHSRRQNSRKFL